MFKSQDDFSNPEPRYITCRKWPRTHHKKVVNTLHLQCFTDKPPIGRKNGSYPYDGCMRRGAYYLEAWTLVSQGRNNLWYAGDRWRRRFLNKNWKCEASARWIVTYDQVRLKLILGNHGELLHRGESRYKSRQLTKNFQSRSCKGEKTPVYLAVEKVVRWVLARGAVNDIIHMKVDNRTESQDFVQHLT